MIEINNEKLRQIKLRISALSNGNRQKVISVMSNLKHAESASKIAIKARLSASSVQNTLNLLHECKFVEKVPHYSAYKFYLNDIEIKRFLNKIY